MKDRLSVYDGDLLTIISSTSSNHFFRSRLTVINTPKGFKLSVRNSQPGTGANYTASDVPEVYIDLFCKRVLT